MSDQEPAPEPDGMPRRDFVKGAIVLAAGAAAGAAVAGMGANLSDQPPPARTAVYLGAAIRHPPSFAPRGTPLIALRATRSGLVEGLPWNLQAHRAICRTNGPELEPDYSGDNLLRFWLSAQEGRAIEQGERPGRFADRVGQTVRLEDLRSLPVDEGFLAAWRTPALENGQSDVQDVTVPVLVLRIDPKKLRGADLPGYMLEDPPTLAFNANCTHFCCVLGWHQADAARLYDAWDNLFCTCHHARYDPYEIQRYEVSIRHDFDPEGGTNGEGV